jgi:glucans biosynthesis protein C
MNGHDRLHALDAVRGFALIAGVVLHACMSFLPGFAITGLPIVDNSPSVTLGVAFFVIHMFRMSLFFFIAGFFGRLLLERDGVKAFIGNRVKRILLPLVAFWFIVFPFIIVAVIWGAIKIYGPNPPAPPAPPTNGPWLPFPLTHLWFLYVLMLVYSATLVVRWLVVNVIDRSGRLRAGIDAGLRAVLGGPFATTILAAPLFICLSLSPDWPAWFGIPTPDHSLIPNLAATIAFTTAFALGWLVHRQIDLIKIWEQRWWLHLGLAIALTAGCLWMTGMSPLYAPIADDWRRVAYAACYCLGIWNWSFAILGMALKFCSGASPVRRYVADASYWIYLLHLPLVFLLQVAVQDANWHWSFKIQLILLLTFIPLFVSYHLLVRPTLIGAWLNGRRYPPKTAAPVQLTAGSEAAKPPVGAT